MLSKGSWIVLIRQEFIPARFQAFHQIPLQAATDIPKSFIPVPSLVLKTESKQQNTHDFMCWQQEHPAGWQRGERMSTARQTSGAGTGLK